jgi:hypothetical protein
MTTGYFLRVWKQDQQPGESAESYYDETIGAVIVRLQPKKKRKRRKARKSLIRGE